VGEATPTLTGKFEVLVNGKLIHSKSRGDGYCDEEVKIGKVIEAIKRELSL